MIPSSQLEVVPQFVVKKGSTGTNIWYTPTGASIENGDVPQYFYVSVADGTAVDTTIYAFLSYGTELPTADDYKPYTSTTATLSLPSTVYGGEVDAATGEGVETWETTVLSGAENWVMSGNNIVTYISNAAPITRDGTCSHFKYLVSESGDGIYCMEVNGTMTIALGSVLSAQYTTETWASYLAAQAAEGTPVTIAYKLATPTSITATGGQQIDALAGVNTVITDADSLTVTGRADPVAMVQALADRVAALEQAAVNSINNTTEG